MNIDLSKMTHVVRSKITGHVIGIFPDADNAESHREEQLHPNKWQVVPITPPTPKYPKADVPTHCVVDQGTGAVTAFGTEEECQAWSTRHALPKYVIRTCDHWFVKEQP